MMIMILNINCQPYGNLLGSPAALPRFWSAPLPAVRGACFRRYGWGVVRRSQLKSREQKTGRAPLLPTKGCACGNDDGLGSL
jgi:hypothetical protein